MLQVVLIDLAEPAHVVAALAALVTANGKALKVGVVPRDTSLADLKPIVRKLASRARLEDCLLISDSQERAHTAHGIDALTVEDPAEVPLLVAARIGEAAVPANLEVALRSYLDARHDLDLTSIESSTPDRIRFRATAWRTLEGAELGDASGVGASFPVEGVVTRRADGHVDSVMISEPSEEALQEARSFVASLVHHGQLDTHAQGQRARGTHRIVVDAQGRRRLIRSRVSYR